MHLGCLGRYPTALLEDKRPVHRLAMPGHRDGRRLHQSDHRIQGAWPFFWDRIRAKGRRPRRLDQVAGKQQVGVGHNDDQVAIGVAAAEMSDLDPPITQV